MSNFEKDTTSENLQELEDFITRHFPNASLESKALGFIINFIGVLRDVFMEQSKFHSLEKILKDLLPDALHEKAIVNITKGKFGLNSNSYITRNLPNEMKEKFTRLVEYLIMELIDPFDIKEAYEISLFTLRQSVLELIDPFDIKTEPYEISLSTLRQSVLEDNDFRILFQHNPKFRNLEYRYNILDIIGNDMDISPIALDYLLGVYVKFMEFAGDPDVDSELNIINDTFPIVYPGQDIEEVAAFNVTELADGLILEIIKGIDKPLVKIIVAELTSSDMPLITTDDILESISRNPKLQHLFNIWHELSGGIFTDIITQTPPIKLPTPIFRRPELDINMEKLENSRKRGGYTKDELQQFLFKLDLTTSGNKTELVNRIKEAL